MKGTGVAAAADAAVRCKQDARADRLRHIARWRVDPRWINDDDDVAWIIKMSEKGRQYGWQAHGESRLCLSRSTRSGR